jgi:hypothetical protein
LPYQGTIFVTSHEIRSLHVNISCDKSPDLIVDSILEECATDFTVPCDQIADAPTTLSASIVEVDSPIDSRAPTDNIADRIKSCDMASKSNLDHILLVRHDDVLAKISHENSLWSIAITPPMSLSHARNKVAELKCLKSVYAPDFTFNLIGNYGVDKNFLVHKFVSHVITLLV